MKNIFLFIIFTFVLTDARSQKLVGLGVGFDYLDDIKTTPYYSEKDVNVNFSNSWKYFVIEVRQGFRYSDWYKGYRFNTYGLIGFTTPKDKFFVFDFLTGVAYSWATHEDPTYYAQYVNQICPTIKTSFQFRLSEKNRLYLGLDGLISSFRYISGTDKMGYPNQTGSLTGSALISINYRFKKTDN
jgi:hypothetical protein